MPPTFAPSRRAILLGTIAGAFCGSRALAGDITEPFEPDRSDAFTERALQASLDRLAVQKDLRSGGPGDIGTGDWLERELKGAGFSTQRQAFQVPYFDQARCSVSWNRGDLELLAHVPTRKTGASGLTAPLFLSRPLLQDSEVAAAIWVVVLPHGRHSSLRARPIADFVADASARGALAIILVTTGPTGEAIALNDRPELDEASVPIVFAAPRAAGPLIAAAQAGATARLVIDGEVGNREATNVIGRRPGVGGTVVISTPRSGWGPCMGERGPGIATWVALAKVLPRRLASNELVFVATSGHEFENLGGEHFIEHEAPSTDSVRLWVHLGAGFAARDWHEIGGTLLALPSADPQRFLMGNEDFLPTLRNRFAGLPGLETPYPASSGSAGELGVILGAGYKHAFGMLGAHRFHHVGADGPDKTNGGLVLPVAIATASAIQSIVT